MIIDSEMPVSYGQYDITDGEHSWEDQGAFGVPGPPVSMGVLDGRVIVGCATFWGPLLIQFDTDRVEPDDDLDEWEVVLEIDLEAAGGLLVCPWADAPLWHMTHEPGTYRVRLYAKGIVDTVAAGAGAGQPLDEPLETHRLACWPIKTAGPSREVKRA